MDHAAFCANARRSCSSISLGRRYHISVNVALRTELPTLLPTDSLAWVKIIVSPSIPRFIGLLRTINLPPPRPRSSYEDAYLITDVFTMLDGTHGTSPEMEPSFGFSLLWTTKTPNCVFRPSRSCSGNSCTTFSTSCWSSEIAYLRQIRQWDTPVLSLAVL
jgi:hypothetical protein